MNVCDFRSFDLDDDQRISETELSTLIDITGFVDLDEFFEKLDVNKGKADTSLTNKDELKRIISIHLSLIFYADDVVTIEEYNSSQIIKEACS